MPGSENLCLLVLIFSQQQELVLYNSMMLNVAMVVVLLAFFANGLNWGFVECWGFSQIHY